MGRGGTLGVLNPSDTPTYFAGGNYRRRIRLVASAPGVVDGGLEDDQHYFTVALQHDGACVVSVTSASLRAPWSTCAAAADPLRALAGMPLSDRSLAVTEWTESHHHCTHQLDLAALAAAHAARVVAGGAPRRQYDAEIPFGLLDGEEHTVTLVRDDRAAARLGRARRRHRRAESVRRRHERVRTVGRRDARSRRRRGRDRPPPRVQHRHEPGPRSRPVPDPRRHARACGRSATRCSRSGRRSPSATAGSSATTTTGPTTCSRRARREQDLRRGRRQSNELITSAPNASSVVGAAKSANQT